MRISHGDAMDFLRLFICMQVSEDYLPPGILSRVIFWIMISILYIRVLIRRSAQRIFTELPGYPVLQSAHDVEAEPHQAADPSLFSNTIFRPRKYTNLMSK